MKTTDLADLDSLLKERDALQAKVSALQQNDDAMAAQIKALIGQKTEWMDRATRLQQERDEAVAALKASSDWLKSSNDRWKEIVGYLRRLAGPEKEGK